MTLPTLSYKTLKESLAVLICLSVLQATLWAGGNHLLPDGAPFAFWEDETLPTRTYYVDGNAVGASDENPGTAESPWLTIEQAARTLKPGERVIVREGIYREHVRPSRGGNGPYEMIIYEAAEGERVVIKGSIKWEDTYERSVYFNQWSKPNHNPVWKMKLAGSLFQGANPFSLQNYPRYKREVNEDAAAVGNGANFALPGMELRRGQVFVDGQPLEQVTGWQHEVLSVLQRGRGAFWVEDNGMAIHFTLPGFADPNDHIIEVTVNEQVFAPEERHLNYIRVSGFTMMHAGNGVPIPSPQRGLLSANAGHHWIIEDCVIEHANTIGIDIGGGYWNYPLGEFQGGHIIRRNVVRHCGLSALSGWHNRPNERLLVEDNLFEDIAQLPIERRFESAGVKLHGVQNSLIRRNVFRRSDRSASLWLDAEVYNTRITQNVFSGLGAGKINGFGHIFIEVSLGPCLIDNNILIGSKLNGFYQHDSERCVVVQNLIANIDRAAVFSRHGDPARKVPPWDRANPPLENEHRVYGNIITSSSRYIHFPNETSRADFNLYAEAVGEPKFTDGARYDVELSGKPWSYMDFASWQESGQDQHSLMQPFSVSWDMDKLELRVFGFGLGKLPSFDYDYVEMPAFSVPEKWLVVVENKKHVLNQDFPPPYLAELSKLLQYDILGNARDEDNFEAGPLVNPDLSGKVLRIDPRRLNSD